MALHRRSRKIYFKACMKCKMLVPLNLDICPNCNNRDFSEEWEGMVVIFDVEKSLIAKRLNISKPGRYAVKLRA